MADEEKLCFVISPIGEEGSPTRKRANQVLSHVIRPAAEHCGYRIERSDDISQPGIITKQIIEKLLKAPLVIADLTERNPNVFYEVAIRHVVRKPLVQLIEVSEQIPFDLSASRMIKASPVAASNVPLAAVSTTFTRQLLIALNGGGERIGSGGPR